MATWHETPYKTGRPVAVPGFPRPVFPPDASNAGKQPSENGPDIEAYKRTVWRAGRWPGPASGFDRAYSNAFSHGRSGNVGETGVAGVQRQQGIDDTGWIGQATFDELRRIRVPDGPHKGEPCMDANAANLIAQAWQLYGGAEPAPAPPPTPAKTTRQRALEAAITHLGYTENPPGSNNTLFGQWYGVNYQPWCAMFCTHNYEVGAGGSPSFARGQSYAYVPYIVSDARNQRNGLSIPSMVIAGDLVCLDWARDGTYDHVEMFEAWQGGSTFTTIGGNTSAEGSSGSQSNGGGVFRRNRSAMNQATTFVRVA